MTSSISTGQSIRIPAVWVHKTLGNNYISHRLAAAADWQVKARHEHIGYTVYEDADGQSLCVTTDDAQLPVDASYILSIKENPTGIQPGKEIKGAWKRHPMLRRWLPEELLSAWMKNPAPGIYGHESADYEFHAADSILRSLVADCGERLLVIVAENADIELIADQFSNTVCAGSRATAPPTPIVGLLREPFDSLIELAAFAEDCNVVVSTIGLILGTGPRELRSFVRLFSHAFIDGMNQLEEAQWAAFREVWGDEKVLRFRSKN